MASTLEWSTEDHRKAEAGSAWESQLCDVYGRFRFERAVAPDFTARLRHRDASGFRMVECVCDPCEAYRTAPDMAADSREVLGIQLLLSGRERIVLGDEEIALSTGDVLIWDTTRPMRFQVLERLHKLSVLLPLSRLQCWLPRHWHSIRHKLDSGSSAAQLLSGYVQSVSPGFMSGAFGQADGLTESAIGLLVNALEAPAANESSSLKDVQLDAVRRYIDANLDDPHLTPASIAKGTRISVRYLHWLFQESGTTAFQYLVRQRLLRCRRDLGNPRMAHRKITDIAFSAGFHNATHFARRFREEFGMSPRDFRAHCGEPGVTA